MSSTLLKRVRIPIHMIQLISIILKSDNSIIHDKLWFVNTSVEKTSNKILQIVLDMGCCFRYNDNQIRSEPNGKT